MSSLQAASSPHHLAHLPPETHPSEDLERRRRSNGGPPVSHAGELTFYPGFFVKKGCLYLQYNVYIYIWVRVARSWSPPSTPMVWSPPYPTVLAATVVVLVLVLPSTSSTIAT